MTPRPVLLLAVGNESRGDDALGPVLARQAAAEMGERVEIVEIVETTQLQIENTLDMQGRRLVLIVDAGQETPVPFDFREVRARPSDGFSTHALGPESLLGVFARVHGEAAPPTFVLCLAGETFGLDEPLSRRAGSNGEAGLAFVRKLLERPVPEAWRECAGVAHA